LDVDCYPFTALPHASRLFCDYARGLADPADTPLPPFYSPEARENVWRAQTSLLNATQRHAIAALLREQNRQFGAGPATLVNLDRLESGANAVVTGQQTGLFGGPLLGLLKAATAVRLAQDATEAGHPHVPIFWLASEDHDFDEVNQVTFFADPNSPQAGLQTLRLPRNPAPGKPVGAVPFGPEIMPLVEELRRCLGPAEITDLLASLYTPEATFSSAFAALIARLFAAHGLIVIDAAARPFHSLAKSTLRMAIEDADAIHAALLERNLQLEAAGYHAQVTVGGTSTLLFLLDEITGVRTALKKQSGKSWSAGARQYSNEELLAILEDSPERISPNVLLRPVMQDTLLPTSAYVGGPAEIAYFAQSQVVYQHILGRATPVLPRLSATLIEPKLEKILHLHQLALPSVFTTADALAQQLGARSMPVEGKRKLSATGNALEQELKPLVEWMHSLDAGLGHSADIAASKMLYQMNRLRRLSASFTLQREQSLRRHADALNSELFPGGNLQERVLTGAWVLAKWDLSLIDTLLEHAPAAACGHQAIYLQ
jgi:bacillithiol biosynthesis cysteine-adding enzyme BshC